MMRRIFQSTGSLLVSSILVSAACSGTQAIPDVTLDPTEAAATIEADDFRLRIGVLAHDSMRGRDTPSPELAKAAAHIAGEFESFGLAPGAEGGFLQMYPLTMLSPGAAESQSFVIQGPGGEFTLAAADFVALTQSGVLEAAGSLQVVEPQSDMSVARDGIALIPIDRSAFGLAFGSGLADAMRTNGVQGVVLAVDETESYQHLARFVGRSSTVLGEPASGAGPILVVDQAALPEELGSALNAGSTAGWSATLRSQAEATVDQAMNTIGVLEGSDPLLKDEYVVFSAHMDHVGVGRAVDGDSIYNGADDDASGTSAIMELAQAYASLGERPRRSLVFLTVSGEEKGLFGSEWYSEHPTLPLESTVANLNIDMIGRNWQDTIVAIGKSESSLGPLVEQVSASHPDLNMSVIDDRWPEENFYFRSDHYNFARKGVPILFFFNGVHDDYHRPSDEPEKIGYDKISRITRLIFFLGLEVANADERPVWDPDAYERVVEGGQ
ncbi:MAG: M28 family peptidase [Gemmatimonadota bacterium]